MTEKRMNKNALESSGQLVGKAERNPANEHPATRFRDSNSWLGTPSLRKTRSQDGDGGREPHLLRNVSLDHYGFQFHF